MKSLITTIKGAALAGALLSFSFASAQEASFVFSPSEVEVYEGESFEAQVIIETGNVPFTVFDLHLTFDSQYLQVTEVELLEGNAFNYHIPAEFSNAAGRIDAAAFKLSPEEASGSIAIANVTFSAVSPVELTQVKHIENAFPRSIIAYGGESVMGTLGQLDVTIVGNALSDNLEDGENGTFSVWPNPANEMTQLAFTLVESQRVVLEVFSAEGKLIDTLFEGEASANVPYQFDYDVNRLATGNYTCRLAGAQGLIKTVKLNVTN